MKKLIKFIIRGKVQGIGFRFSCMEAAYRYSIKGYVRNRSDGSVSVEAEGTDEMLKLFREWCHKGPLWAKVTEVEEAAGTPKDYRSFEIVR